MNLKAPAMDGSDLYHSERQRRRHKTAKQANGRDRLRALVILLGITLATLAGIVALDACGIAPVVPEAGIVQ